MLRTNIPHCMIIINCKSVEEVLTFSLWLNSLWTCHCQLGLMYNSTADEKQWLQTGSVVEAGGRGGKLSSEGLDPTILTDQTSTYKWLVKVTPGSKVNLTWMVSSEQNVTLKVRNIVVAWDTCHGTFISCPNKGIL